MTVNDLFVRTQLHVHKPAADVYEAIVDPEQMSNYFISSGTDRLDAGATVTWTWADYGVDAAVMPWEMDSGRLISFSWAASGRKSDVRIDLEPTATGTMVTVREGDWPRDDDGTARALEQMQGWQNMLCCLKAWLEHGINLRK